MTDAPNNLDTRRDAHARVEPTKAETCARIILFAIGRGTSGLTADELAEAWNCSHNHVAPRISELKASGLLVETDDTRLTRAGSRARVLVARQFKMTSPTPAPDRAAQAHKWITGARAEPDATLFGNILPDRSYKE